MSNRPAHTIGSGKVFADLGSADPDLALAKATLVRQLDAAIVSRHLTQKRAAELLRVDQADLSKLLRGRTRGFSLDRLFKMLTLLDLDLDIDIHPVERTSQKGRRGVRLMDLHPRTESDRGRRTLRTPRKTTGRTRTAA